MKLNWRHKTGLFLTLVAVGCGLFLECSAKQAAGIALLGIAFAWLIGSLRRRAFVVTSAILICAVGLYVAVTPVWSDLNSVRNSAAQYDSAIADLQTVITASFNPPNTLPADFFEKAAHDPIPQIVVDPDFAKLSGSDQRAVLSHFDPDFGKLSAGEFLYVVTTLQKRTSERERRHTVTIPESAKKWMRSQVLPPLPKGYTLGNPSQSVIWETQYFPETMSDTEIMKTFQTDFLLPRPTFSLASSVRAHPWNVFGGLALFGFGLSVLAWLFRRSMKQGSASLPLTVETTV